MEIEAENKNRPTRRISLTVLIILLITFIVYYSAMMIASPGRKLKAFTEEFSFKPSGKNKIDERIFTDSSYLKLLKERAFLQSRIAMAETDSIYLTINLADSIINLEICGVSVYSSKFSRQQVSKILRTGNKYILSTMFSRPFTVSEDYSSIKKVPLMIKMAPKDTSEFKPDIIPDTADVEPVNYIMETENGTRFIFYQEEKMNPGDGLHQFYFDLRFRLRNFVISLRSILGFKIPEYHPYIKLRIPRADAKIFYRGLPENGQIAVFR
jgi:hypothetical protein